MDKKLIYDKAIAHYGEMLQKVVAMEEMSELTKEISKDIRGKSTKTQIMTEIADVIIMLDQLKIIFKITDQELESEIEYKLARLNNRIREEQ